MATKMRRAANDKVWVIGQRLKAGFTVKKIVWGYDEPPWQVVRPPDEVREAAILVGPAMK